MSVLKSLVLFALVLAPLSSQAVSPRMRSTEEIATDKVTKAVVENDLHFVTASVPHLCGSAYLPEGTDVKVQVAAQGHYITIRHYGVTYAGIFTGEKTVKCTE